MPLSMPQPRTKLHHREITLEGFERDDGLIEIEAHLTDVKSYGFTNRFRGTIGAGEPIHDMRLRITMTRFREITEVEAVTDAGPFADCAMIAPNYKRLIGLTIGPDWRRQWRERIGGIAGCTHLTELLAAMATVAYQTLISVRPASNETKPRQSIEPQSILAPGNLPGSALLNSCFAWREGGSALGSEREQKPI